ncbi:MAG TPA: SUKH-3 domain-containing protein, partial [Rugosimonospora sp.]|nr:SUKH-3 domain-containing protein [Rugosimonospora sp.]
MISREQAQQAAREWALASLPAGGGAVSLWEFDLGYVVGHVPPPREPGAPPTLLGAPRAVVDKETGEVTVWPSIAWEEVAQRYTADRAARRRFPEEVRAALGAAGWLPGRDVTARVEVWLEKFHADFPEARSALPLFPVAAAALAEFGGLRPRGHTP